MTRHLTLTTGILLVTLSLLYLGVSTYTTNAPQKVDTVGELHVPVFRQADAPVSVVVFTDYRCPHCRTFERAVMPRLAQLGETDGEPDERRFN